MTASRKVGNRVHQVHGIVGWMSGQLFPGRLGGMTDCGANSVKERQREFGEKDPQWKDRLVRRREIE